MKGNADMSETTHTSQPAPASAVVHAIDDLVRPINPATFSASVHGAGHHVVLSGGRAGPHKKTLLGGWLGGRDEKHYFVKSWTVPKEVKGWRFRWSEGTSAISLDFEASFVIQANEDVQAYRLVEVLSAPPNAGEALYQLINGALNEELSLLEQGTRKTGSLLGEFRRSSIGAAESEDLNGKVGTRVRNALGGAAFRIGFQLLDAPPMQVEVHRVGAQADPFTLADSRRQHVAETEAMLRLENYQVFRKSNLRTEEDVRKAIGAAITEAVKALLFGRKYYDVIKSFWEGPDSLDKQMRARIEKEAEAIGYSVQMFNALPDMAALRLLEPLRIDIDAKDEKYDLKNSVGYVQFGVALVTQAGSDVSRLHLLIQPDATDVVEPIAARVRQICRDTVQRFDHLDFNLAFEDKVVKALTSAICDGLGGYGLTTQVVNIRQEQTEEGGRFKAIRGRTIDFAATIPPHANAEESDPVPVSGTISVETMTPTGWEAFESKDFGYRSDSSVPEYRMRALAQQRGVAAPAGTLADAERRNLAIDLELAEIAHRVTATLEGKMAMGQHLSQHWTTADHDQDIRDWAEMSAVKEIADEFGLVVKFYAFRRLDTNADITAQTKRLAHHEHVRAAALADAAHALNAKREEREVLDRNRIGAIEALGKREREVLGDPDHPEGEAAAERLRQDIERGARHPQLTAERAAAALKFKPKTGPDEARKLAWAPSPPQPDTSHDTPPDQT